MDRDIFYIELRECMKEVKALSKDDKITLFRAIDRVLRLEYVARKYGILSLEEAVSDENDLDESYLKSIVLLAVDGNEPELIEEIGIYKLVSSGVSGCEKLKYLMYLCGLLTLLDGKNPRVIQGKLLAMLPGGLDQEYEKYHENAEKMKEEQVDMSEVENLCNEEFAVKLEESSYFLSKLLNYILPVMEDEHIQRLLRDVDNHDLALAMKGVGGEARRHVFKNLSDKLAARIADDMREFDKVKSEEIGEATKKVLTVLLVLMDLGEIQGPHREMLNLFYNMFHTDKDGE